MAPTKVRQPPPPVTTRPEGGGSEWVELIVAANDIEAHLVAGRLVDAGIEWQGVKDRGAPGAWLYGGSNPWAPVTILVRRYRLEDAQLVLAEVSFENPGVEPVHLAATEIPRAKRASYRITWWLIAIVLGIMFTLVGLVRVADSGGQCPIPVLCTNAGNP